MPGFVALVLLLGGVTGACDVTLTENEQYTVHKVSARELCINVSKTPMFLEVMKAPREATVVYYRIPYVNDDMTEDFRAPAWTIPFGSRILDTGSCLKLSAVNESMFVISLVVVSDCRDGMVFVKGKSVSLRFDSESSNEYSLLAGAMKCLMIANVPKTVISADIDVINGSDWVRFYKNGKETEAFTGKVRVPEWTFMENVPMLVGITLGEKTTARSIDFVITASGEVEGQSVMAYGRNDVEPPMPLPTAAVEIVRHDGVSVGSMAALIVAGGMAAVSAGILLWRLDLCRVGDEKSPAMLPSDFMMYMSDHDTLG